MSKTMLAKVRAYLAQRRALGFQLKGPGGQLLNFARYADRLGHRGPLTRQLAMNWASLRPSTDRPGRARRLELIRTFAQHLLVSEPHTQLPPRHGFGPAHRRPCPYLYTSGQIQHLLHRAGRLPGRLRPKTWQTLISLLLCSGLRISEARHLKINDVDWHQALLVIRQSKRGKTRLVPLHPTALPPLRAYAQHRQKLFPLTPLFFVSETGTPLALSTVEQTFIKLRQGLPFRRRPPRLHDLRHTMACRVLHRWLSSRDGAVNRILILSRFLGHDHVQDTYWYLSAWPQLLKQAAQRFALSDDEGS